MSIPIARKIFKTVPIPTINGIELGSEWEYLDNRWKVVEWSYYDGALMYEELITKAACIERLNGNGYGWVSVNSLVNKCKRIK